MSALCCSGGEHNLILLDRTIHKPNPTGTVGWAGSTFGPLHKSRVGEHEFEALMRTLDNLVSDRFTDTIFKIWPEDMVLKRNCEISTAVKTK